MIPRILEYNTLTNKVDITPEAYTIPEIHALIEKYESDVYPYLSYISSLAYPDSQYKNIPADLRPEAALFDIKESIGDFDEEEDMIEPAVQRLRSLWESPQTQLADELEEELHRWRKWLKDTPFTSGLDGSVKDRLSFVKEVEKISAAAANVRRLADDEIGTKMKGSNEMGEY